MIRTPLFTSLFLVTVSIPSVTSGAGEVFTQKPEVVPVEVQGVKQAPPKKTVPKSSSKKLSLQSGPKARWIWGKKPAGARDRFYFRRVFTAKTRQARIIASGDNHLVLWINGKRVFRVWINYVVLKLRLRI